MDILINNKNGLRRAFLITLPMFMGYASLFGIQKKVKNEYGIPDDNSSRSHDFGICVAFLYINNFLFRFLHYFVFRCVRSYYRIIIGMCAMMASMIILALSVYTFHTNNLAWVLISYTLGGIGIGTFEPNVLDYLTPYGGQTQEWSSYGIPAGITTVTVGGFILMELGLPPICIYCAVFIMLLVGICVLLTVEKSNMMMGESEKESLIPSDEEFKLINYTKYYIALGIDMFCVSVFSPAVMLYLLDGEHVEITPLGFTIDSDIYFSIYNTFTFLGAFTGRKLAYYDKKIRYPMLPLICAIVGALIDIFFYKALTVLTFIGGFLVMFTNGYLYNQTWRYFDKKIEGKNRLKIFSLWLLVGDIGSVIGSLLISRIKAWDK
jgi:hypothetical protein